MENVVAFVHALTKGAKGAKLQLENQLSHMGVQIAKQKRRASLTHVIVVRDMTSGLPQEDKEAELEEIRHIIASTEQVHRMDTS